VIKKSEEAPPPPREACCILTPPEQHSSQVDLYVPTLFWIQRLVIPSQIKPRYDINHPDALIMKRPSAEHQARLSLFFLLSLIPPLENP
jgi:hypothetical protein